MVLTLYKADTGDTAFYKMAAMRARTNHKMFGLPPCMMEATGFEWVLTKDANVVGSDETHPVPMRWRKIGLALYLGEEGSGNQSTQQWAAWSWCLQCPVGDHWASLVWCCDRQIKRAARRNKQIRPWRNLFLSWKESLEKCCEEIWCLISILHSRLRFSYWKTSSLFLTSDILQKLQFYEMRWIQ